MSDATGLVNRLDVQTGGYSFEVKIVSNFDVSNFEFDEDEMLELLNYKLIKLVLEEKVNNA